MKTNTNKNGRNNGGKLLIQEIIIHHGRNVKKRIAHPQKYTIVGHWWKESGREPGEIREIREIREWDSDLKVRNGGDL